MKTKAKKPLSLMELEKKKSLNCDEKKQIQEELKKIKELSVKMETLLTTENKERSKSKPKSNRKEMGLRIQVENEDNISPVSKKNDNCINNLDKSIVSDSKSKTRFEKESNVGENEIEGSQTLEGTQPNKSNTLLTSNEENTKDKPEEWETLIDNQTIEITHQTSNIETEQKKGQTTPSNEQTNKQTPIYKKKLQLKNPIKEVPNNDKVQDLIDRMDKFSKARAAKIEEKRKKLADEILEKATGVPKINERSRKMVNKDFSARLDDYKTNSITVRTKLYNDHEEKIKRDLTPDFSNRKRVLKDSFTTVESHINFQFAWETERKQKLEMKREKENQFISQECTFTPKISRKSKLIAESVNKETVVERLYDQDRLKKRNRYIVPVDNSNLLI